MSNELTTKLTNAIELYEKRVFSDLLSAHGIKPSVFKHAVLTEIKRSPQMLQAFQQNPSSLFASIIFGAQLGLVPSETLGQFYLIPYNIKNQGLTVKPLIGYQGLVSILLRGGTITNIWAESVHEADEFEYALGLNPRLEHKPLDMIRNATTLTHVYVVAQLSNGTKQFKVMSRAELLQMIAQFKVRNELYFSMTDSQFWMLKKLCLKQLSKVLPKDYLSTMATKFDDNMEGGATITLSDNDEPIVVKADPKQVSMFPEIPKESEEEIGEPQENA
jgi:recombination protein RecT